MPNVMLTHLRAVSAKPPKELLARHDKSNISPSTSTDSQLRTQNKNTTRALQSPALGLHTTSPPHTPAPSHGSPARLVTPSLLSSKENQSYTKESSAMPAAGTSAASSFPQLNPQRMRSYVLRLPLCTRIILLLIVAFWVAGISHGFQNWAQLSPEAVFSGSSTLLYPQIWQTVGKLIWMGG